MERPAPLAPGVHLVHKPVGPSSHAVVEGLRAGKARMCHGGALDPFAEGLLLVLVGEATRLFPYLHGVPKRYVAEVAWGEETDTGDPGGEVVARGDSASLNPAALDAALAPFIGWHAQVPPVTSNKRVEGERAWVRAARGEEVELPPSRVLLSAGRWLRHDLPRRSTLEIEVAGGFYVRALARELGRATGARAHLTALHRTAIGPWDDPGPGATRRIQGETVLPWCPLRRLTVAERGALTVGATFPRGDLRPPSFLLPPDYPPPPVVLAAEGRVVGLAEVRDATLGVRLLIARGL